MGSERPGGERARTQPDLTGSAQAAGVCGKRLGNLDTLSIVVETRRDDPFERVWRDVEARWADPAAHRKFIAFCAAQGALSEAGSRYRVVREKDPARAEQARRGADAVLAAAMQSMHLARTTPEVPRSLKLMGWVSLAISGILLVYGVLALLRRGWH